MTDTKKITKTFGKKQLKSAEPSLPVCTSSSPLMSVRSKSEQLFDELLAVGNKQDEKDSARLSDISKTFLDQRIRPLSTHVSQTTSQLPCTKRNLLEGSNLNWSSSQESIETCALNQRSSQSSLVEKVDVIRLSGSPEKKLKSGGGGDDYDFPTQDDSMVANVSHNEADSTSHHTRVISNDSFLEISDNEDVTSSSAPLSTKNNIASPGKRKPIYRHTWSLKQLDEDDFDDFGSNKASLALDNKPATAKSIIRNTSCSGSNEKVIPVNKVVNQAPKIKKVLLPPQNEYDQPVMKLKCKRSQKEMYTVVKHVKPAHQCRESGEFQEINDDIVYYMSNLVSTEQLHVKRLSLMTLAEKCIQGNFRSHMRSYGHAKTLFRMMAKHADDPVICLAMSCILYLLNRDRSILALDGESLDFILKLIEFDHAKSLTSNEQLQDYHGCKEKIMSILSRWYDVVQNSAGHGQRILFEVTLDNLSSSFLATESLVYFVIRNQEDCALKTKLCSLGCLDLIVNKLELAMPKATNDWDLDIASDNLKLIQRHLRILEFLAVDCPENQAYLVGFNDGVVIDDLVHLFINVLSAISRFDASSQESRVYASLLRACLKVFCNLTHLNENGCQKLGSIDDFLIRCVQFLAESIHHYIPREDEFDFLTLTLSLLINLIESSNANRRTLIAGKFLNNVGQQVDILHAVTDLFIRHETAASLLDAQVDKKIEFCSSQQNVDSINQTALVRQVQRTLDEAVGEAGQHMEDCMIAAHIALFFGLLMQQNEDIAHTIKTRLVTKSFDSMIIMLNKFIEFLRLIDKLPSTSERTMYSAIELLEKMN